MSDRSPSDWPRCRERPARDAWAMLRDELAPRARPRHGGAARRDGGAGPAGLGPQVPARPFPPAAVGHAPLAGRAARRACAAARGAKLNVLGPRGGAKSTLGTLAFPLRAALEGREPYIWIVSDTKHQACAHLENIKTELLDNALLAADYPEAAGRGPVWRAGAIVLRNGVTIEAFGTGPADPRPPAPRAPAHADRLRRPAERRPHRARPCSASIRATWFHGTLMKAGTPRTNVVNLATALHREALAMELHATPGWTSRVFQAIDRWPENMSLWAAVGGDLHRPARTRTTREAARRVLRAAPRGDGRRRGRALARGGGPVHADVHAGRERAHGLRAREAELADQSRAVRMARERTSTRRSGSTTGRQQLAVKTLALDPSKGSDARRGDYSAFVMLGVDRQGMLYVEADLARRPTPQIVADGVELFRRFRPDVFGVEANQFQDLLAGEFEAEFRRQGMLGARPVADREPRQQAGPHPPARPVPGRAAAAVQSRQPRHAAAGRAASAVSHRRPRRRPRRRWRWPCAWRPSCCRAARRDDGLGNRLPVGGEGSSDATRHHARSGERNITDAPASDRRAITIQPDRHEPRITTATDANGPHARRDRSATDAPRTPPARGLRRPVGQLRRSGRGALRRRRHALEPLGGGRAAGGAAACAFADEQQLAEIRDQCRALAVANEFAINGHENRIRYIVGSGHAYRASPPGRPRRRRTSWSRDVQAVLDEFVRVNHWHQRQQEIVRRKDRDGECFLRLFVGRRRHDRACASSSRARSPRRPSGPATRRPPSASRPIRTTWRPCWATGSTAGWSTPAEIQHRKANVDANVKRGLPLFYPGAQEPPPRREAAAQHERRWPRSSRPSP